MLHVVLGVPLVHGWAAGCFECVCYVYTWIMNLIEQNNLALCACGTNKSHGICLGIYSHRTFFCFDESGVIDDIRLLVHVSHTPQLVIHITKVGQQVHLRTTCRITV